jgi:hypothetical protein
VTQELYSNTLMLAAQDLESIQLSIAVPVLKSADSANVPVIAYNLFFKRGSD